MTHNKQREEFLLVLMVNCPERTYRQVMDNGRKIMRAAKTHHGLQVRRGNYGLTEQEKRRELALEKRITALAEQLNPAIKVNLGGDYRGYTTKLVLPGGQYNSIMGGPPDGWGVPV